MGTVPLWGTALCLSTDPHVVAGAGVTPLIHGPSGASAHGADEWVDVESIVDTAKVFAVTAVDYCGIK